MLDSISRTWARVKTDILALRNIEAYVVAALAIGLAVLGVVDVGISLEVKLAVLLAAMGLLVFNLTVPEQKQVVLDDVLKDRSGFLSTPERIRGAKTLWIYAPSAVQLLDDECLLAIHEEILSQNDGQFRVIIQDPLETASLDILVRQLDKSVDYPVYEMETAIQDTIRRLERIQTWKFSGKFEYRFLSYGPGFSLVAIDPEQNHGSVTPEFFGYHNKYTGDRMHIEITRRQSPHWYKYWVDQFDYMWKEARNP